MGNKHKRKKSDKRSIIGTPTGLLDCNGKELLVGDYIRIKGTKYVGPVLWHNLYKCYGLHFRLLYGTNRMDTMSYRRFIKIRTDNGMMDEILRSSQEEADNLTW